MSENRDSPVWDVYNELRTARLNVLCYERQYGTLTTLNTTMEYLLAVLTSSSVAGFWFWKNETGDFIWKILGVIAVVLAIGKPILNLNAKIREKGETVSVYQNLYQNFLRLKIAISQEGIYGPSQKKEFEDLLKKKTDVVNKHKGGIVSKRLCNKCYSQVTAELPVENFFIPKEV